MGWFAKLNFLRTSFARLKTSLYFKPFFGAIGSGSLIMRPILITNPRWIFIGKRVAIRDGARIEVIQTNPARVPRLEIGDGTTIEQNVHIICHGRVRIGSNVSITANCAIVDLTHPMGALDTNVNPSSRVLDEDSWVEIEDGVFVGVGTVILPKVRIGRGAVIGANSVVNHDVPPFAIVGGAPARILRIRDGN